MTLKDYPTADLVEELIRREGVEATYAEPYAHKGWSSDNYTEIVAECFSVKGSNDAADAILKLLE